MRIVLLSDTHCQGRKVNVPDGDMVIHCGDLTYRGTGNETSYELEWFSNLPHKYKLLIAGNHELGWENDLKRNYYRPVPISKPHFLDPYPNIVYLHDSGIEIDGIKFWGSPVQPHYHDWAFQKGRGAPLQAHWAQIPDNTDVLITHGPPYGFGDTNGNPLDDRFGDKDLLDRVLQVKPKYHVYGHAHGGYGEYEFHGIHFVNAAICTEEYKPTNPPIIINVDKC